MYRIEMYVEAGHWSVLVEADRERAKAERNSSLKHRRYQWSPSSGSWVALGGVYASEDAALSAIAGFMGCSSAQKPKRFRVVTGR